MARGSRRRSRGHRRAEPESSACLWATVIIITVVFIAGGACLYIFRDKIFNKTETDGDSHTDGDKGKGKSDKPIDKLAKDIKDSKKVTGNGQCQGWELITGLDSAVATHLKSLKDFCEKNSAIQISEHKITDTMKGYLPGFVACERSFKVVIPCKPEGSTNEYIVSFKGTECKTLETTTIGPAIKQPTPVSSVPAQIKVAGKKYIFGGTLSIGWDSNIQKTVLGLTDFDPNNSDIKIEQESFKDKITTWNEAKFFVTIGHKRYLIACDNNKKTCKVERETTIHS